MKTPKQTWANIADYDLNPIFSPVSNIEMYNRLVDDVRRHKYFYAAEIPKHQQC